MVNVKDLRYQNVMVKHCLNVIKIISQRRNKDLKNISCHEPSDKQEGTGFKFNNPARLT